MDFLAHSHDLSLTNCGVQSVLHLFLKLNLALPEQDLALCLDNLRQNVRLFFLQL